MPSREFVSRKCRFAPRPVLPRSAIIDPVTITANRTGSSRSPSRTVADRIQPTRSKLTVTGKNRSGYGRTVVYMCLIKFN